MKSIGKLKNFIILALLFIVINLSGCKKHKEQFLDALLENDWETAQSILDKSPELVHLHVKSGGTLLHAAVYYDNEEMLKFLLKNGLNVDAVSKDDNETALFEAALENRYKMASLLLENGADVNTHNEYLWTPLHEAAMYSDKKVIELLITHGADIHAKEHLGFTPLYIACVNRDESTESLEVVETLLLNGANPEWKDSSGVTLIKVMVAYARGCSYKKAQLLEDYGAKLEIEIDGKNIAVTVKELKDIYKENRDQIQEQYERLNKGYLETRVQR